MHSYIVKYRGHQLNANQYFYTWFNTADFITLGNKTQIFFTALFAATCRCERRKVRRYLNDSYIPIIPMTAANVARNILQKRVPIKQKQQGRVILNAGRFLQYNQFMFTENKMQRAKNLLFMSVSFSSTVCEYDILELI